MDLGAGGAGPRGRRRAAVVGAVVAAVVVVLAVVGVVLWTRHQAAVREQKAQAAAARVAAAWTAGRWESLPYDGTTPAAAARAYRDTVSGLAGAKPSVRLTGRSVTDDRMTARLAVSWTLPGGARWSYPTAATLVDRDGSWRLRWSPAVVHPRLHAGDRLLVRRTEAGRASILGRDDQPLMTQRPVVEIGIHPAKAKDLTALSRRLGALLDVDAARLEQRARAAKPDNFVPVITLRREDYDPLRDQLRALDGTVFREKTLALAPSRAFARALLGTVGPVTKELVDRSGGRLAAGDDAGLSGLSAQYDERLAGTPGTAVYVQPAAARGTTQSRTQLWAQPARPGKPLRTTIDPRVQNAADAAVAGTATPSALVAVDVRSGDVLAVANGPQAAGYDRALLGHYPPGSTFKVVTTLALLQHGLDVNQPVECPQFAHVQGKSFHNYEHEVLGAAPFHVDFAKSCNTAFIGLSNRLGPEDLTRAASMLGVGAKWSLGTAAFAGDVPTTTGAVDLAAASFGQGRVVVSPLAMAVMAASVARGSTVTPRLVTDPAPPAAPAGPTPPPRALTQIQQLMREVVTSGTARVLAGVPGGPVHAKTGTAEYGSGNPPKTHVWIVGYQGDVAFAAFVEDGKSGAETAGPVVKRFLGALQH